MASTRIYRTAGTPTLNTKHTISLWFKRSRVGFGDTFIMDGYQDANNRFKLAFDSSDRLELYNTHGGSYKYNVRTNRLFRDTAAFYHLVVRIDTTQASASDRVRVYVNGTEEESFNTYTDATQDDANNVVNESGATISIGDYQGGNNGFGGLMTHFHFVDGTSYGPDTFGETDTTSGIWKPKTAPSVTYGNNGFFLKFENSGNLDLDSSGNNLTFTTSGSLTQNVDTPTNVFATGNPLNPDGTSVTTLINGNLTHNNNVSATGTFAVDKGKLYFEVKRQDNGGSITNWMYCGYRPIDRYVGTSRLYRSSNGDYYNGSSYVSYGASWGDGDIIGVALDYDNDKIEFYKNGVSQGAKTSIGLCDGTLVTPQWQCSQSSGSPHFHANFGSGFFGTTAVASANADANGFGAFEYTVPSGYYALCTKNIKEFG